MFIPFRCKIIILIAIFLFSIINFELIWCNIDLYKMIYSYYPTLFDKFNSTINLVSFPICSYLILRFL